MSTLAARTIVAELVDGLPPQERDIINGLYWERVSWRELGRRLDMDTRTVRRLRDRALRRLGAAIEDFEALIEEGD